MFELDDAPDLTHVPSSEELSEAARFETTPEIVREFKGEYRFLSSFWPSPMTIAGTKYPTVEHFYQSMKAKRPEDKLRIINAPRPGQAKRLGRRVGIVDDWGRLRIEVMRIGVHCKFEQNPDLRAKLLATGDARLREGNTWGDRFWGVDLRTGEGKNQLGKLLMQTRTVLRADEMMEMG